MSTSIFNFGGAILSGLLNGILAALQAVYQFLYALIQAVWDFLYTYLSLAVRFLFRMFGFTRRFFTGLWDGVIKRGLLKIMELWDRVMNKLRPFLLRLHAWIERIRAIIDKYYFKYVAPILNLIQRVRQTLLVFRLFHFKWAEKLDERLGKMEQALVKPFLIVRAKLNEVISFLDLAFDLGGLIKGTVLSRSIGPIFGVLMGLLGVRLRRPLTFSEEESQERDRNRYTSAGTVAHQQELTARGLTLDDKAMRLAARSALRDVTGLPESTQFPV